MPPPSTEVADKRHAGPSMGSSVTAASFSIHRSMPSRAIACPMTTGSAGVRAVIQPSRAPGTAERRTERSNGPVASNCHMDPSASSGTSESNRHTI